MLSGAASRWGGKGRRARKSSVWVINISLNTCGGFWAQRSRLRGPWTHSCVISYTRFSVSPFVLAKPQDHFLLVMEEQVRFLLRMVGTGARRGSKGFLHRQEVTLQRCANTAGTDVGGWVSGSCGLDLQSGEWCVKHFSWEPVLGHPWLIYGISVAEINQKLQSLPPGLSIPIKGFMTWNRLTSQSYWLSHFCHLVSGCLGDSSICRLCRRGQSLETE